MVIPLPARRLDKARLMVTPPILSFTCIIVATYFYIAIPYLTASTSNLRFSIFTSQVYNFIRTTLVTIINPNDNIKNPSLISWVLLPVIFLMNRRCEAQSFFYNESDDFNVIEKEPEKPNEDFIDIVVKAIQSNRLVGSECLGRGEKLRRTLITIDKGCSVCITM
jgi:hypothetical protein